MRLFVSTDFQGRWPVGTSAVVTATDEAEARKVLAAELETAGLPPSEFTLQEVATDVISARILNDGDY